MATHYSNSTDYDNGYYEIFNDTTYAGELLGSIFRNANIYATPVFVFYGVLVSIVALLIIICRRLWLRHEAYVYLIPFFISNIMVLTVEYGSHVAEALFGTWSVRVEHSSIFMCKIVYFFANVYYFPVCVTTLLLINSYMRLILPRQTQVQQSRLRRCSKTLIRVYCTPFASMIVAGAMFCFTCSTGVWAFWMVDMQLNFCYITTSHILECWRIFAESLLWIFPVVILLPVITTIIWFTGSTQKSIQFFRMTKEAADDEFIRLTLWFSIVVFVAEFPMVVLYLCEHTTEQRYTFGWALSLSFSLLHGLSLCVLSSLCLFGLTSFRNEIRCRLPCFRRRRPIIASPTDSEGKEMGKDDLQLDVI